MAMMRELPRSGGVAVQGEDEIASIGMCIGAAMAGSRAMTATSGPGLSLYSENIGLAVMGEVPLVIVDVQRMGPSTGGATTVSQGDVQFVRWGTAGGYPIIALAPSNVVECYTLTARAFHLAERFRCPVFVLTDKETAMTLTTVDLEAYPEVGRVSRPTATSGTPYRYAPRDAVAPLRSLGSGDPVRFTGSTHDEHAVITKDASTVDALNRHLAAKIEEHTDEIESVTSDLDPDADTVIVGYGVTAGAVQQAVASARRAGHPLSSLIIQSLWPVPTRAIAAALDGVSRIIVPELNVGLYRREIERLAGDRDVIGVTRIDGKLISSAAILEAA
jgi:2-oxoglutarate ferredoxin oxidoreductase subunit alpha